MYRAPGGRFGQRPADGGDLAAPALASLAPDAFEYVAAWRAWQRWTDEYGLPVLPAAPVDVADYLMARHTAGGVPATVHSARAAIAKV